jgi:hypothetical protein
MSQFGCTRLTRIVKWLAKWMIYQRPWQYTEQREMIGAG